MTEPATTAVPRPAAVVLLAVCAYLFVEGVRRAVVSAACRARPSGPLSPAVDLASTGIATIGVNLRRRSRSWRGSSMWGIYSKEKAGRGPS